jgi:hypothetical protein
MIFFDPLTQDDLLGNGITIGPLMPHEVSAIKAAISKQTSKGNYHFVGIGAIGKYAMTPEYLELLGYTQAGKWIGFHGFNSQAMFLGSDHTQEMEMNRLLLFIYSGLFEFSNVSELAGLMIASYFLGRTVAVGMASKRTTHSELYTAYLNIGKQAIQIANS